MDLLVRCRIFLYGIKAPHAVWPRPAGRHLVCPPGPIPLAARGLAAVLAQAGPAGADGCHRRSCPAAMPTFILVVIRGRGHRPGDAFPRPVIVHAAPVRSRPLRVATRWPAAGLDRSTAARDAARTRSRQGE